MSPFSEKHHGAWLSPDGQRRYEAILELALAVARRRRIRRRACAAFVTAGLAIGILAILSRPIAPQHPLIARSTAPLKPEPAPQPSAPAARGTTMEFVKTDPSIISRLAIRETGLHCQSIDDDLLLKTLAPVAQASAIVRNNGRPILIMAMADLSRGKQPGATR